MYSQADFDAARRHLTRYSLRLAAALTLLAAVEAVALIKRVKPAALTAGASFAAVAVLGVAGYIIPCRRYLRFLNDMRQGLSREMAGRVVAIADAPEEHDGARVLPVRLYVHEVKDERIVYLNADKREMFPQAGAEVRVILYGRHVKACETP